MQTSHSYKPKFAKIKRIAPDYSIPTPMGNSNVIQTQYKNIANSGGNKYNAYFMISDDQVCTTPVKKSSSPGISSSKNTNYTASQEGANKISNLRNQYSVESSPTPLYNTRTPYSCEKSLFNLSPTDYLSSPYQTQEKEPIMKQATSCCQKRLFAPNTIKAKGDACNIEYKVIDQNTKYNYY